MAWCRVMQRAAFAAMKTHPRSLPARAFTLIELLVVITLIGILTSLAMSAYKGVITRARNLDAAATNRALISAIQNYSSDYHRMPVRSTSDESPIELSEGSPLLQVLLGDDIDHLNPKRLSFLDLRMGKNGAGGLVGKENSFALVDPWGTPYRVVLDANWDQRITNPDATNEDPDIAANAPAWLPMTAAAFSAGVDKKFGTADDVVSWR